MLKRYTVVRIGAEEQWFRRARACQRRSNIAPQRKNARLREVPACLVQLEVKLNRGGFIQARPTERVTGVVAAGIRKRRSRLCRQTVQGVVGSSAVGTEAGNLLLRVEVHRRDFIRCSRLRDCL